MLYTVHFWCIEYRNPWKKSRKGYQIFLERGEKENCLTHVHVVVADSYVGIVEGKHHGRFVEIGLKR